MGTAFSVLYLRAAALRSIFFSRLNIVSNSELPRTKMQNWRQINRSDMLRYSTHSSLTNERRRSTSILCLKGQFLQAAFDARVTDIQKVQGTEGVSSRVICRPHHHLQDNEIVFEVPGI